MPTNLQATQIAADYFNNFLAGKDRKAILLDKDLNILAISEGMYDCWEPDFLSTRGLDQINKVYNGYHLKEEINKFYVKAQFVKVPLDILGINFNRKKDAVIMLFNIDPIINKSTNDVIAFITTAKIPQYPISLFKLPSLINKFKKFNLTVTNPAFDKLSDKVFGNREVEIVFLLFYFDTIADIAQLLSLRYNQKVSPNIITKILHRKIYPKFEVKNLKTLKDKALMMGYHKHIPVSLMIPMVFEITEL